MYRGYKINKQTLDQLFLKLGYSKVENIEEYISDTSRKVQQSLMNIYDEIDNDSLDGERIMQDWFPEIDCNVFISHSHNDIHLAKVFAGWLYGNFGITSFIDSSVWGYANDLLKIIDDKYCKNYASNTYNYIKRNFSTSHIHMMLMAALNKMIDKTECIIFLNTSSSNVGQGINDKTLSPWIYGEIETTRIIRKERPKRVRTFSKGGKFIKEELNVRYPLDLEHLMDLNSDLLLQWSRKNISNPLEALDKLYDLTHLVL